MYLKKIELHGFKSFADRISIDFTRGITAVVGPNGSGKSNISDAFRWCLGEQSAKSLRGTSMQDVIFAGTVSKKRQNAAEVFIEFADCGTHYDYDTITIKRKVYRSGESEYLLNGKSCRLKDIHELFMDTGIGAGGYSIVGQGKIADIITKKSDDRRLMLEEAAGITKYRHRREEAMRKLSATDANITRLADIVQELEERRQPLSVQSEKAKAYIELRDKLKVLEIELMLAAIGKAEAAITESTRQLGEVAEQIAAAEAQAEAEQSALRELTHAVRANESAAEQRQSRRIKLIKDAAELQSESQILQNNIKNSRSNIERQNAEIGALHESVTALADEIELLQRTDKHKDAKAALDATLESQTAARDLVAQELSQMRANIDKLDGIKIELLNKLSDEKQALAKAKTIAETFTARTQKLDADIAEAESKKHKAETSLAELEQSMSATTQQLTTLNEQQHTIAAQKRTIAESVTALTNAIMQRESTIKQLSASIRMLSDMDREGMSTPVRHVTDKIKSGELQGLHGTVATLVQAETRYATAIEVALGGAMQYIVAETEADAKAGVNFLKRGNHGRATFLSLSGVKPSYFADGSVADMQGYIGIAKDLVSYDDMYADMVSSLLGRTVVVDEIDNAIRMAKANSYRFRIVTLSGEILSPGGLMSGGSMNKSGGFISRAGKIADMKSQQERELSQLADEKSQLEAAKLHLSKVESDEQSIAKEIATGQNELHKRELDLMLNKQILSNSAKALSSLSEEKQELIDNAGTITEKIAEHQLALDKTAAQINETDMQRTAAKNEEIAGLKRLSSAEEKIRGTELKLAGIMRDIDANLSRIQDLEKQRSGIKSQLAYKQLTIAEEEQAIGKSNTRLTENASEAEAIAVEQQKLETEINQLTAEKADLTDKSDRRSASLTAATNRVKDLQAEHNRLNSTYVKHDAERENEINKLWDAYELTPTYAREYLTMHNSQGTMHSESGASISRQVNELKEQIKALGNINVEAIAEYENLCERLDFLCTQRDDLEQSKARLIELINEITATMTAQFKEQFTIINAHFEDIFKELFGGGRATLILTEPDDILNGGVDIEVCPPGKTLKNITLLSGGEQCLSAICLLFAILKVRPAPFYILDEIEAALDDVNVARFAEYLKRHSEQTQFILITHRRGTMEAADTLHGVTMQQKGISEIVSFAVEEFLRSATA